MSTKRSLVFVGIIFVSTAIGHGTWPALLRSPIRTAWSDRRSDSAGGPIDIAYARAIAENSRQPFKTVVRDRKSSGAGGNIEPKLSP
jgi:hypothetical protein